MSLLKILMSEKFWLTVSAASKAISFLYNKLRRHKMPKAKDNPQWQGILDGFEVTIRELFEPPFLLSEAFALVDGFGKIVAELTDDNSKEAIEADLRDAWGYLDGKFQIVRQLDKKIKAGILEPLDGPIIRNMIEEIEIPALAESLAK